MLPPQVKLRFFAETRHSYGHTALMLSGGASFGKFHCGLIRALYEQDLMPRIIAGSSAGSMIAAAICCKPYDRLHELLSYEGAFPKPIVSWTVNSWYEVYRNLWEGKTVLCAETMKEFLKFTCGDLTFMEIYDRYSWTLNITVTD